MQSVETARLSMDLVGLRAMKEIKDGDLVFPGVGAPMRAIAQHVTPDSNFTLLSENGLAGHGPILDTSPEEWEPEQGNAAGYPVSLMPGASFMSQLYAFIAMAGRNHVDIAFVGSYQVSEKGDFANWISPRHNEVHVGGAMDIAVGAKKLVAIMKHFLGKGQPRIVKGCTLPVTAKGVVSLILTDLAVIEVTSEGLLLREVAPGVSAKEVQAYTEPELIISKDLCTMSF